MSWILRDSYDERFGDAPFKLSEFEDLISWPCTTELERHWHCSIINDDY